MAITLDENERPVLEAFKKLDAEDPEGSWNAFYIDIIKAAGDSLPRAEAVCRRLRSRKLLTGQGRGQAASYYITDKGKEALA